MIIPDPEIPEVIELHPDRAFPSQYLHLSAAHAASRQVSIQGGPVGNRFALKAAFPFHDVDEGTGPPVRVFLAQLDGPGKQLSVQNSRFALVRSHLRQQPVKAFLPVASDPFPCGSLRDRYRPLAGKVVRALYDAPDRETLDRVRKRMNVATLCEEDYQMIRTILVSSRQLRKVAETVDATDNIA